MRGLYFPAVLFMAIFCTGGVHGGFQYASCPGNWSALPPAIPCDYDCRTNHAATGGHCVAAPGDNTNCICENPGTNQYNGSCTYFNEGIEIPTVCQCASNVIGLAQFYAQVCTTDCRCNHGALGGTCNWGSHPSCTCDYNFPNGGSWTPANCDEQAFVNAFQALANVLNLLG